MTLPFDISAPGFSLVNARACAEVSRIAYQSPNIATDLAHVLVAEREDCVVVAFRGTASVEDFITDAKAWRVPLVGPDGANARVHAGFLKAIEQVMDPVVDALHKLPLKPLMVTGHSLGGASAVLFADRLLVPQFKIHSIYTFGQPRVGDALFASLYDDNFRSRTFRFIDEEDLVPRLPGWLIGYRHAGREIFMPSFGSMRFDAPLWFKVLSDGVSIWRNHRKEIFKLLSDHHIDRYIEKVNALKS